MIPIDTYAGQNWVITPAALVTNTSTQQPVNWHAPTNVHGTHDADVPPWLHPDTSWQHFDDHSQKWLLILSGVGMVDLRSDTGSKWLHEALIIHPDLSAPLQYAISRYPVPRPQGVLGSAYNLDFQVIEWAPFAAPSSVYDERTAINFGVAVDNWRPHPFDTGQEVFTQKPLNNLFRGIQVDVAVRDKDAWLYRVSYNITLLGYIVYLQPPTIF